MLCLQYSWIAIRIILDIAKGLAVAHRESIFHRDIKPDNILLTKAGANFVANEDLEETNAEPLAKLSDFGLASSADQSESMALTQHGAILGTPLYMSPELLCGEGYDMKSDVWSIGCVAFE